MRISVLPTPQIACCVHKKDELISSIYSKVNRKPITPKDYQLKTTLKFASLFLTKSPLKCHRAVEITCVNVFYCYAQ